MQLLAMLAALTLGQCQGSVCPSPAMSWTAAPVLYQPTTVIQQPTQASTRPPRSEWAWHQYREPSGSLRWAWGWKEGRMVCFVRSEQPPQPPVVVEQSKPTPREPEADEAPREVVGAVLPTYATQGVDRAKLASRSGYQTNSAAGRHFVETEVKATGGVPDDRDKPRLTVIGADADTAPVMAAVRGTGRLAELAAQMHVQSYTPESPYVAGLGFAQGKPAIYVQTSSGRVLHRQGDFSGGEAALVAAIERSGALRKADPTYDPDRDTDHREPGLGLGLPAWSIDTYGPWLAIAAAVALAYFKRRS